MKQKRVSPTRVEVREPEKRSGGEYYPLPLPDEIELLEIDQGDTVVLELVEEEVQGKSIRYIQGHSGEAPRNQMTVRRQSGCSPELFIQCPAAFSGEHGSPPFNELGKGDRLVVEVLVDEGEFRIYGYDDYRYRFQQLSEDDGPPPELPLAIPLIASNNDGYTDLSGEKEGQEFEIVPFHGQDEVFVELGEEMGKQDLMRGNRFRGIPNLLRAAGERTGIPERSVDKIEIYWDSEDVSMNPDGEKIYEEHDTDSAKVVLPEQGSYLIIVEAGEDSGSHWLAADPNIALTDPIRDKWSAFLFEDSEELQAPKIYIPVPRTGKGHWDTY
ncbi:hypothetical protein [Halorarum halobium]|uniref:hypothetical protein n=1 Tax=Halorarum halobium TaxID=3075121 RepID=UPI0028AFC900|nr:hypothetical protein [Halobaculum sp. XH14]